MADDLKLDESGINPADSDYKKKDIYFTATDAVELGIAVFHESIEKD